MKKITIIIPVFNEAENVPLMYNALTPVLESLPYNYEIIYVDDGSKDGSLAAVKYISSTNDSVKYISLSRNFGHQNALKAGFDQADGDAVITMDGDLQHPPPVIIEMLALWEAGNDIVYTIRKDHLEIPKMKRKTSDMFYNMLNSLSDIELEKGTADFRLMDKKVVSVVKDIHETDLFWRGLVKWLGFTQIGIEYEPGLRIQGKSKYSYRKMIEFALKGITSFSTKPLTLAIYIGLFCSALSFLYIPYALISIYMGRALSGWASIIVTVAFFSGIQLMILGIIGMYLGKAFMQNKQRPHYIIKSSNL